MTNVEPNPLENYLLQLQEHGLEMNEYKQQHDNIPIDNYMTLLDYFIQITRNFNEFLEKEKEFLRKLNEIT